MRTLATLCASLSLLTFAACNGGGSSGDDTGDDVIEPDAETGMPDAEVEPDADTSCTTDTECVGQTAGATLCMGAAVVTCSANGLCLDATTVPCNVGDMCVDDGSPACETPVADGESCATAMPITADTTIAGADFTADFANDHDFTDASCDAADPDTTNSEAVFTVTLAANERLTVTETVGLDTVMGVQATCGDASACLVADDDPNTITYVPAGAETVFVYVGTYADAPASPAYSLDFDISSCGDGVVDADFEECDDGLAAADNDGCSTTCTLEFGYDCTTADPTVCTALPDLGTFGGGATISHTGTAIPLDEFQRFTVTFTAPVRVNGNVTATGAVGDPEWYAYSSEVGLYGEEEAGAVETIGEGLERYFTPGKYVVEVYAYEALTSGYTMTMNTVAPAHLDLGTFAAGATIPPAVDGDGLVAGTSDYFMITFTAAVLVDGSLTSATTGDMDLYWWGPATRASSTPTSATRPGPTSCSPPARTTSARTRTTRIRTSTPRR